MKRDFWDDEDKLCAALGICGGGQPRAVMALFERSMTRMSEAGRAAREHEDYKAGLHRAFQRENALDDPLVWAHFYQLDHLGLVDHGGFVCTGWLTPKGEETLVQLRKYLAAVPSNA